MDCAGYKIYHVRGHYYTTFYPSYSDPAHLGREILTEVPANEGEYQEWKRFTIAFYKREEKRIQQVAKEVERYGPVDLAEEINEPRDLAIWGRGYNGKPSRTINFKHDFTWVYIVDLDTDRFLVIKQADLSYDELPVQRRFRLDNIPRWLFDQPLAHMDMVTVSATHPLVVEEVADQYKSPFLYGPLHPDQELPGPNASYVVRTDSKAFQRPRDSIWGSLRLLILRQLIHRYHHTNDSLDDHRTQAGSPFLYRQIAYAMVSIAHGASLIRFRERSCRYEDRIGPRLSATPWWEPPDTDTYWVGGVLILLDPGMDYRKDLRAMIEKAVHLTQAQGNASAIIFSGESITIAHINHAETGATVSKSGSLWFFSDHPRPYYIYCCKTPPTPAFLGLLHTLRAQATVPSAPLSYPPLPIEICENIYSHADLNTQCALRISCRLFNEISRRGHQYPKIGEWKLMKPGDCPSRYSAALGSNTPLHEVDLKADPILHGVGYEVGILTRSSTLELGISLFNVKIAEGEGCCRNYPEDARNVARSTWDAGSTWEAGELYLSGCVVGFQGAVEQRDGGRRPLKLGNLKICNES